MNLSNRERPGSMSSRCGGKLVKTLVVMLPVALILVIAAPALPQGPEGDSFASKDQYGPAVSDQYGSGDIGHEAANDALQASRAFSDTPDSAQTAGSEEGTALAAEVPRVMSEPEAPSAEEVAEAATGPRKDATEPPAVTSLPNTGGIPLERLGLSLLIAGLLARRLVR
jgi:hypothetical protein